MALSIGARLGPYEILSALGTGGMGEVYRARDTRLKRDVAIKVLPEAFAQDPDRLARFQREAELLATLNHPNIAAVYGIEQAEGLTGIVMELVEGETLAEKIDRCSTLTSQRSGLPLDETLAIARQIVDALEAAHEKGVIHRDLKPANVKVTPEGKVKVLDFGLAKLQVGWVGEAGDQGGRGGLTHSPTQSGHATMAGVILGTAAYMSPEQARGKPVDRRTDIWAFGCLLFEMLTGRQAFDTGETVSDAIAAILTREPDVTALPASTPAHIRTLLRRCLQKDPQKRLPHIGIARLEIDEGPADTTALLQPAVAPRKGLLGSAGLAWSVAAVLLLAAIALAATMYVRRAPADSHVYRTTILPPGRLMGSPATRLALSPDGRRLAFVAPDPTGRPMLWIRPLDALTAQPLPGTESGQGPFWSPNGRFIAFFAGAKLKKIDASGGPALTLCDATGGADGTWNRDDVILFTPTPGSPISRVAAAGGTPSPVTSIDTKAGEGRHAFPYFLPDGRHFLYLALNGGNAPLGVYVGSLDSTDRKRLLDGGANAMYAQGFLVFLREATLMAQAFDAARLELTGDPAPLAESVQIGNPTRTGTFAVSQAGVLVYQAGFSTDPQLVWFDRSGQQLSVLGDRANYADLNLSPDGTHASVSVWESDGKRHIWVFDVTRGLRVRFTIGASDESNTIWSPDSSRIIFNSSRKAHLDLYQKAASGVGSEDLLLADSQAKAPTSWSPDGRFILYSSGADMWVLPLVGDRKPFPFAQTPFNESQGRFSPDGHWIAYVSNEAGRNDVYVAPFQGLGGKSLVSTAGGSRPRWRRDGKELFYVAPNTKLMAVTLTAISNRLEIGAPQPLFDLQPRNVTQDYYDVSPDGQRFLVNTTEEQAASAPITVVVNWTAALKR